MTVAKILRFLEKRHLSALSSSYSPVCVLYRYWLFIIVLILQDVTKINFIKCLGQLSRKEEDDSSRAFRNIKSITTSISSAGALMSSRIIKSDEWSRESYFWPSNLTESYSNILWYICDNTAVIVVLQLLIYHTNSSCTELLFKTILRGWMLWFTLSTTPPLSWLRVTVKHRLFLFLFIQMQMTKTLWSESFNLSVLGIWRARINILRKHLPPSFAIQ